MGYEEKSIKLFETVKDGNATEVLAQIKDILKDERVDVAFITKFLNKSISLAIKKELFSSNIPSLFEAINHSCIHLLTVTEDNWDFTSCNRSLYHFTTLLVKKKFYMESLKCGKQLWKFCFLRMDSQKTIQADLQEEITTISSNCFVLFWNCAVTSLKTQPNNDLSLLFFKRALNFYCLKCNENDEEELILKIGQVVGCFNQVTHSAPLLESFFITTIGLFHKRLMWLKTEKRLYLFKMYKLAIHWTKYSFNWQENECSRWLENWQLRIKEYILHGEENECKELNGACFELLRYVLRFLKINKSSGKENVISKSFLKKLEAFLMEKMAPFSFKLILKMAAFFSHAVFECANQQFVFGFKEVSFLKKMVLWAIKVLTREEAQDEMRDEIIGKQLSSLLQGYFRIVLLSIQADPSFNCARVVTDVFEEVYSLNILETKEIMTLGQKFI